MVAVKCDLKIVKVKKAAFMETGNCTEFYFGVFYFQGVSEIGGISTNVFFLSFQLHDATVNTGSLNE